MVDLREGIREQGCRGGGVVLLTGGAAYKARRGHRRRLGKACPEPRSRAEMGIVDP